MYSSIYEALSDGRRTDNVAIEGIGKKPMTYGRLKSKVDETVHALHDLGYGRGDRIAVMMPNSPELASAVLSIASGFTCAPLNPVYTHKELDFYLSDMKADAVLVSGGFDAATESFIRSKGIPVITLTADDTRAGIFNVSGDECRHRSEPVLAGPKDIAVILHTSGTTSKPKLVPILQFSIISSAWHSIEPLRLTEKDKCLNVMPLFHVHGLIGAVLTTLVSGGSVVCTPGFLPDLFMGWLKEYRPTWYTAVPTMHQYVLKQASLRPEEARASGLRFIRSTSASLPTVVMERLESVFGVPVLEGYGMTETPHLIAINPLPPLKRKPGSVGLSTELEISILNDEWDQLLRGVSGEIALKGSRIISGYENNPEANAKSFKNGWFRTGDRGHLDDDGYLFIEARIKEIINRGGEKLSPIEIEEALLSHPAVSEAAVFPIPDPSLGENIGAAVVLTGKDSASADDLKRHVSGQLAYFKVPAMIRVVSEIPKGPTGKIHRIGMYDRLMADASPSPETDKYEPPATPTETVLAGIWEEVLEAEQVGRHDSFFDLGGDSLRATMVISRIEQAFNIRVSIAAVIDCDTIEKLGEHIDRRMRS